eukprot:39951-Hanusia_phi.AAC.1
MQPPLRPHVQDLELMLEISVVDEGEDVGREEQMIVISSKGNELPARREALPDRREAEQKETEIWEERDTMKDSLEIDQMLPVTQDSLETSLEGTGRQEERKPSSRSSQRARHHVAPSKKRIQKSASEKSKPGWNDNTHIQSLQRPNRNDSLLREDNAVVFTPRNK